MELDAAKLKAKVRGQLVKNLHAACYFLQAGTRTLISTPSRTVTMGKTRAGKDKKILGARGSNRSKPGEPPHKDHGTLRTSIAVDVNEAELVGRVGTNLPYGKHLELGTKRMAARPFLRRSLLENREKIVEILNRGFK
jgi:phage gpG-like protein